MGLRLPCLLGFLLRMCNRMRHLTFFPTLSLQLKEVAAWFFGLLVLSGNRFSRKSENFESFALPRAYVKKLLMRPEHSWFQVTETGLGRLKKIKTYADKVDVYFASAQSGGFLDFCKNGILQSAETWNWGDCKAKINWNEKRTFSVPGCHSRKRLNFANLWVPLMANHLMNPNLKTRFEKLTVLSSTLRLSSTSRLWRETKCRSEGSEVEGQNSFLP